MDAEWKESFKTELATFLGIAPWRVVIDYVRGGSIQVGVSIIDTDSMGAEPTAQKSAEYIQARTAGGALTLQTIVLETVAIIDSPPPPPPPPIPGAPVEDETTAQQLADAATAIIAGAAGGGGALLILIIVVVIVVVCCCCKGKKGANAPRGSCVTGEATSASQVTINMGKASSSRMNDRI